MYLAIRWRAARLDAADWVALSMAGGPSSTTRSSSRRADLGHALQPNNVALALAAYVLHRLCDPAERLLLTQSWARTVARFTSTRLVTLPVAVVVLLALGLQPSIGLDDTAQRFHRTIPKPAELPIASGYTTFDAFTPDATPQVDGDMISDVGIVLDAAAGPDGHVFDFTNSPLLFNFLIDRRPEYRFFDVAMAIRQQDQQALIDEFESSPPDAIVWSSLYAGLPAWDGIWNQVRHYDVADWILDRYEPYASVQGYGVWVPKGRAATLPDPADLPTAMPATRDGLYDAMGCDWGTTPNYFSPRPTRSERARAVTISDGTTVGCALPDERGGRELARGRRTGALATGEGRARAPARRSRERDELRDPARARRVRSTCRSMRAGSGGSSETSCSSRRRAGTPGIELRLIA